MEKNSEASCPKFHVESEDLEGLKRTDCEGEAELGSGDRDSSNPKSAEPGDSASSGLKAKRKARSTRRRLNAMINNASLHFSDTDSEGELAVSRVNTPNHKPHQASSLGAENFLRPTISVTLEGSDDSSYAGERRGSFLENLTDVDEIYASEPDNEEGKARGKSRASSRSSLSVGENTHQAETELEDMSNDEEDPLHSTIFVKPRSDILCDFNGETITTKEGDGPFSIEVRNQMSIDESKLDDQTPEVLLLPTTDSEDMETSEDEDEEEGACGQRELYEDFDALAASQIVMKNLNKMEKLLTVKEPDDALSDSHTDIEDVE